MKKAYLGSDEAEIHIFLGNKAKNKVVNRLSNVVEVVGWNEKSLELVVFEGFGAEFDIFVTDIC